MFSLGGGGTGVGVDVDVEGIALGDDSFNNIDKLFPLFSEGATDPL